jgi:hypothetical protein
MSGASEEQASQGDVHYGLGAVCELLVVAHEAAPAGHPRERGFNNPAAGKDFEAPGCVRPVDDFDDGR